MRTIATYSGPLTSATHTYLTSATVNITIPGTYIADRKMFISLSDTLSQLTAAQKM